MQKNLKTLIFVLKLYYLSRGDTNYTNAIIHLHEDYYNISLFIPFIRHFLNQLKLNERIFHTNQSILENVNFTLPNFKFNENKLVS